MGRHSAEAKYATATDDYCRRLYESHALFNGLAGDERFRSTMYNDGVIRRLILGGGTLGAVVSNSEGIAQRLIALIQGANYEVLGVVEVLKEAARGRWERGYLITRMPYESEASGWATPIGEVLPGAPVTITPDETSRQQYPGTSDWRTTIHINTDNELGIQHQGGGEVRVLTPTESVAMSIPRGLWAPPSATVYAALIT